MLDLAYLQLKQIFYEPLTLIIGRQDISYGRGFVVGTNPQNPGTAFQATDYSATQSFDAIRAVLDFAPWTVDSFYSKVMENHTNPEDDRDLFGVNVSYQFSDYNGVAEMYYFGDIDRGANSATAALGTKTNETHSLGGRVQFDPISQITLGAELAYQFGDYFSSASSPSRDREAWAWDVFGTYRFENAWKPSITIEYIHLSGEADLGSASSGSYAAWNSTFKSPVYGLIHDDIEAYFNTIQSTDPVAGQNQNSLSVNFEIAPMDDLNISTTYYYFWTDEAVYTVAGNFSSATLAEEIGHEIDVITTYAYTEDVTFAFSAGWFIPGDLYVSPNDSTATEYISQVSVAF